MTDVDQGTEILPCWIHSDFSASDYIKSARVELALLSRFYPDALISMPKHPNNGCIIRLKRYLKEEEKLKMRTYRMRLTIFRNLNL
jgi:hypothetical protein